MSRIKTLTIGGKVSLLPHPFVDEVEWLVVPNHKLLCDAIAEHQKQWIAKYCDSIEDPEERAVELDFVHSDTDDHLKFANNMTLVSLVTLFQHAIRGFAKQVSNSDVERIGLVKNLEIINAQLGDGPVPREFFEGLETVRDSIIHADSKAEWMRGKTKRCVPNKYRDSSSEWVHITDAHLQEAIGKALEQVRWYDERL